MNGAPEKVEINYGGICEFNVYYYHYNNDVETRGEFTPDHDAPIPYNIPSIDYGCNKGASKSKIFEDLFSNQFRFTNLQDKIVISGHDSTLEKNYCKFSVNIKDREDCSNLNYCQVYNDDFKSYKGCDAISCTEYPCDRNFFQNSDHSPITSTNGVSFIPSGITSITITCPSSPPIPYSYSGFTPTFDSYSNILTFLPSDGITGTQSLGGTDPNSVPTTITDIDKWKGNFDMNFVCNGNKLRTSWGDMNFEECEVDL